MSKRVRLFAPLALAAAAFSIGGAAVMANRSGPQVPRVAADATSCKGAPQVPQDARPSAIAVFDPVTGDVRRAVVVGDALRAQLAGGVVVTVAGDGWLRGIGVDPPSEVIWCLRMEPGDDFGGDVAGMAAIGETVFATSGRDVVGVDAASGTVRWRSPVGEPIAGLSAGRAQVYVWTADGGTSSVVALSAADGTALWRQVVSPCASSRPREQVCFVPVGPGRVTEVGVLAVLVSPNDQLVKAFETATGNPRGQFDAGRGVSIAAAGLVTVVYGGDPGGLRGISQDGRRLFTVPAAGHAIAADERAIFFLDQRVGPGGPAPGEGPPRTTALIARSANDGAILWTAEVPGIPQRVGVAGGLLFTSSGEEVAAARAADGSVAWRMSLTTPAKTRSFSVAGSWELLGSIPEGIVAIAAAERPYRD